jgi:sulfur relay protein TusB/DsrH
MLFVLNKTQNNTFGMIKRLGGEEEKVVLLVGDAVFYGTPNMFRKLQDLGVEEIYVAKDALESRNIELHPDAEAVDYDEMAELIMDEHEKVLSI